jgi:hypothetical protein
MRRILEDVIILWLFASFDIVDFLANLNHGIAESVDQM